MRKKNREKILAFVLTIIMVLQVLTFGTFAGELEEEFIFDEITEASSDSAEASESDEIAPIIEDDSLIIEDIPIIEEAVSVEEEIPFDEDDEQTLFEEETMTEDDEADPSKVENSLNEEEVLDEDDALDSVDQVGATSGTCGANLTWKLSGGVLTISGKGSMTNWNNPLKRPWNDSALAIKEVKIQNGVTDIGKNAFYNCRNLTKVTIPDSLTTYGENAFILCVSLPNIPVGKNLYHIGKGAFDTCDALRSVTIPDTVTSLGDYAFYRTRITDITIGKNVDRIGEFTFAECTELRSVKLGNKVASISNDAFEMCEKLSTINFPDSVKIIGNFAFYDCVSLKDLKLGKGVVTIGTAAFSGCSGIKTITMPASVKNILDNAFNRCTALTDVYYGSNKKAWKAIKIGSGNEPLLNARIHYTEKQITSAVVIRKDVNSQGNFVFTGKALKPLVNAYSDDELLSQGADYTLAYKDNTDIGKATITVKGAGEYEGSSVTVNFSIVPPVPTDIKIENVEHSAPRDFEAKWKCFGSERFQYQYKIELYTKEDDRLRKNETVNGKNEYKFEHVMLDTEYYMIIHAEVTKNGEVFAGENSEKIKHKSENRLVPTDFWGVANTEANIDASFFRRFFKEAKANELAGHVGGLCNAMSIAGLASIKYPSNQIPSVESFGVEELGKISSWSLMSSANNLSVLDYIKYAKAYTRTSSSINEQWYENRGDLQGFYDAVKTAQVSGDGVVITLFNGYLFSDATDHTLVALDIVDDSSSYTKIRLYDPNLPNNNDCYLYLYKNNGFFTSFHYKDPGGMFSYEYSGLTGNTEIEYGFHITNKSVLTWRTFNAADFASLMNLANGSTYDDWFLTNIGHDQEVLTAWEAEFMRIFREGGRPLSMEEIYNTIDELATGEAVFEAINGVDQSDAGESYRKIEKQFYCKLKDGTLGSVPAGTTISFVGDNKAYEISVAAESYIYLDVNENGETQFKIKSASENAVIVECRNYTGGSYSRNSIFGLTGPGKEATVELLDSQTVISGVHHVSSNTYDSVTQTTKIKATDENASYRVLYNHNVPTLSEKKEGVSDYTEIKWDGTEGDYKPAAPVITGVYNSVKGGDIRWNKVDGVTGYKVYRFRSAEKTKLIAEVGANTLQIYDTEILNNCWGRVYHYYVVGVVGSVTGNWSKAAVLQRVSALNITSLTSKANSATIKWDVVKGAENKANGYQIQYAESRNDLSNRTGTFKTKTVKSRKNMSSTISGLKKGKAYYFRVRAYVEYTNSKTGEYTKTWSQYSGVKSVKVQ